MQNNVINLLINFKLQWQRITTTLTCKNERKSTMYIHLFIQSIRPSTSNQAFRIQIQIKSLVSCALRCRHHHHPHPHHPYPYLTKFVTIYAWVREWCSRGQMVYTIFLYFLLVSSCLVELLWLPGNFIRIRRTVLRLKRSIDRVWLKMWPSNRLSFCLFLCPLWPPNGSLCFITSTLWRQQ